MKKYSNNNVVIFLAKLQLQRAPTYNEQFSLHNFTRCKRDLMYEKVNCLNKVFYGRML